MTFIQTERIEDLEAELHAVAVHAVGLEPVLQKITDKILARERRLFETRGASSGVYWAPLKATTILRKQGSTFKHGRSGSESIPYPERPLWRFGDLVKSLSERGNQYQRLHVDDETIHLSTTHPAAGFHATGTSRMPRRPPLIIAAKHAHEYDQMISDFIFSEGDYAR